MAAANPTIRVDSSEDESDSLPGRIGFNVSRATPKAAPDAAAAACSSARSDSDDCSPVGRVGIGINCRTHKGTSKPKPKPARHPTRQPTKQSRTLIKTQLKRQVRLRPYANPKAKARPQQSAQRQNQHLEFADNPAPSLAYAFEWNKLYLQKLESIAPRPPGAQAPPALSGYFEFAGGGGAEMACKALSAVGVDIQVKSQADWNAGKRQALSLQDPDECVCRFADIMELVTDDSKSELLSVTEEALLSQYELLSLLGIEQCLVPDLDASLNPDGGRPDPDISNSTSTASTSSCSSSSTGASSSSSSCGLTSSSASSSCSLMSEATLREKISTWLGGENMCLKSWHAGAKVISASHSASCTQCSHVLADSRSDHDGVCDILAQLARSDHDCVKFIKLNRRQGGGGGAGGGVVSKSTVYSYCCPLLLAH